MTKFFFKILSFILILSLTLSFIFACDNEDNKDKNKKTTQSSNTGEGGDANEILPEDNVDEPLPESFEDMNFWQKAIYIANIDFEAEDVTGVSIDQTTSMKCNLPNGPSVYSDIFISKIIKSETPDSFVYYEKISQSAEVSNNREQSVVETGYADGKMFLSIKNTGVETQNLWSVISPEEYMLFLLEMSEISDEIDPYDYVPKDFSINKRSCSNINCVQDDYGNWVATFSGFTQTGLDNITLMLDTFNSVFPYTTLKDISIEITVSPDFSNMKVVLDYTFEGELVPIITSTTYIVKNQGVRDPIINLDGYEQVEDLRQILLPQ